jgi:L-asparaginase / beta-aspartyl-peptidase
MKTQPAFAIHGGAIMRKRVTTPDLEAEIRADLARALTTGYEILQRGGSALDAVEAGVIVLEDSPHFNAGKGSPLTSAGTFELDAAIMDGRTRQAGAVAGVQHIKNPISLARLIMTRSPLVMMIGAGAEAFAVSQGLETVPNDYFMTEARWREYQRWRDASMLTESEKYGTVGAVALDGDGNLAAATSTGGSSFKPPGRIGDSPIVGAGTYASNASCAVSATGAGEDFIRNTVAVDIAKRVEYLGESIDQAAAYLIHTVLASQGPGGGVIVMDRTGHSALVFNSGGMYRGYIDETGNPVVDI